ncbi:MAG: histidinol-phosphatase [Acutalibacteraceae bacterium]
MIYPFDFHTHSNYCDGKDTLENMVKAAVSYNMKAIGFSGHSYTDFDKSYCMSLENSDKYFSKIKLLKEKYKGKIEIYCGIEKDYYSEIITDNFDYVIGSVHYCKFNEKYIDIDLSPQAFKNSAEEYYGGDYYKFCCDYYKNVADIYNKTHCDIIGHFDLITKFNECNVFFDETDKRYIDTAINTVDALLEQDVIFEVNTGAISRGYKTMPYPSLFILKRIFEKGGDVILSGDTHSAKTLMFGFDKAIDYIKSIGFNSIKAFGENGFYDINI